VRYHDAAQFYAFDVMAFCDDWSRGKRLLEMKAYGIVYEPDEVQDIDTPEDWAIAEMKYKARGV
jgi:N-acylneuraminate cytidylyltransferase